MDDILKKILDCLGPKHGAKKQLAEYLGIHPNIITNWFGGRNKSYRRYLPEIAAYFNIPLSYFDKVQVNNGYVTFEKLLNEHNVTAYRVSKETGISTATLSDWKTGKSTPKIDKLQKIADYFCVSLDYLIGISTDEKNMPSFNDENERDIAKIVERIMINLETSGDLMFDGVPMSQEAKEPMAAAMKLGLEAARLKNKETYTPKKYKKE